MAQVFACLFFVRILIGWVSNMWKSSTMQAQVKLWGYGSIMLTRGAYRKKKWITKVGDWLLKLCEFVKGGAAPPSCYIHAFDFNCTVYSLLLQERVKNQTVCPNNITKKLNCRQRFDRSSFNSGRTMSDDRTLFLALYRYASYLLAFFVLSQFRTLFNWLLLLISVRESLSLILISCPANCGNATSTFRKRKCYKSLEK